MGNKKRSKNIGVQINPNPDRVNLALEDDDIRTVFSTLQKDISKKDMINNLEVTEDD